MGVISMKLTTTAIYFSGYLSMKYKIDDTLINFLCFFSLLSHLFLHRICIIIYMDGLKIMCTVPNTAAFHCEPQFCQLNI